MDPPHPEAQLHTPEVTHIPPLAHVGIQAAEK